MPSRIIGKLRSLRLISITSARQATTPRPLVTANPRRGPLFTSASGQRLHIRVADGKDGVSAHDVSMRSALSEATRAAYVKGDIGVQRWNWLITDARDDRRILLPSVRFHRSIGSGPVSRPTWRDA